MLKNTHRSSFLSLTSAFLCLFLVIITILFYTKEDLQQAIKLIKFKIDASVMLTNDRQQSEIGSYFFFSDGRVFKLIKRDIETKTPYAIITAPDKEGKIRIPLPCWHLLDTTYSDNLDFK